jgi:hypothetical protein
MSTTPSSWKASRRRHTTGHDRRRSGPLSCLGHTAGRKQVSLVDVHTIGVLVRLRPARREHGCGDGPANAAGPVPTP